ncbi:thioredoxin family protein [Bdellovibrio sp. HCB337]|uniref:protein-disulfide reductase DsbD family protein n=1 Tax=Bdellovibrio sp. HCB337 TaxID=3394358 RepID=UPI0039A457E9
MAKLTSLICLILLFALPVSAVSDIYPFTQGKVSLLSKTKSWNSSQKVSLGIHFSLQKDWHIYWKNSGDSGAAPKWSWNLQNAKIAQEYWPLPERIAMGGLVNLGYSHEALFVFDLEPDQAEKPIVSNLKLEFLVCKTECIPYFAELRKEIPHSAQTGPPEKIFGRFSYPQSAPAGTSLKVLKQDSSTLDARLTLPSSFKPKNIEIFPEDGESFKATAPTVVPEESQYNVQFALQDTSKKNFSDSRFLVVVEDAQKKKSGYEVNLEKAASGNIALILFWALLGGFILNFMPCVFPVLSIKVLSFLAPDKDPKVLRISGWFYTLGVLASFVALGSILLILRAGGEQIGWGFQLQSPLIASAIALLFFWLGLNFLGTFEIGQSLTYLGATKVSSSYGGSFMTGVLATVVATPCTAPFMGAALGASLALPAASTLLIFAGLGLGMAAPFLWLSYFPQALKFLPKPGAWMQKLKEFLAFPLFATVLWLLWVLSHQISADGVLYLLALFLIVSVWIWGARQISNERLSQALLAVGFVISLLGLAAMPRTPAVAEKSVATEAWLKFDPQVITKEVTAGKSVFIDFTAAWCITCQVNKKLVLNTEDIQALFKTQNVQLYKADWTDKDPVITKALAGYGRNSLPLYVFYRKGSKTPELLPEILTKGIITDLFNKEKEP